MEVESDSASNSIGTALLSIDHLETERGKQAFSVGHLPALLLGAFHLLREMPDVKPMINAMSGNLHQDEWGQPLHVGVQYSLLNRRPLLGIEGSQLVQEPLVVLGYSIDADDGDAWG